MKIENLSTFEDNFSLQYAGEWLKSNLNTSVLQHETSSGATLRGTGVLKYPQPKMECPIARPYPITFFISLRLHHYFLLLYFYIIRNTKDSPTLYSNVEIQTIPIGGPPDPRFKVSGEEVGHVYAVGRGAHNAEERGKGWSGKGKGGKSPKDVSTPA